MFFTQVHGHKKVTDEVKFGYLLGMAYPKIRDKISNLKPGTVGNKSAWQKISKRVWANTNGSQCTFQ